MHAIRVLLITATLCMGLAFMIGSAYVIGMTRSGLVYLHGQEMVASRFAYNNGPSAMLIFCLALIIFIGCLVAISGFIRGSKNRSDTESRKATNIDEVRLMQDLHQGMSRMEERVETLETLLLDRHHASAARPPEMKL